MKKLKGCGKFELDFFVPFDSRAREKNGVHVASTSAAMHSDAGIVLCHSCAAI
jgi:hypothetical protein